MAIGIFSTFYASFQVQKKQLIAGTQEANRVYAMKMVNTIERFLGDVQQQLAYSAQDISRYMQSPELLFKEVERLHLQENTFNSVMVVAVNSEIKTIIPQNLVPIGTRLDSEGARAALAVRTPLISDQYLSASGNLVIILSHPLFAENGDYLGYVAGSIYLKEKNVLSVLIGEHFYQDGSYLYVVDRKRKIIYHDQSGRVGDTIGSNRIIDTVLQGQYGSMQAANSQGISMLAGYAYLPLTGWGFIAQRPAELTLKDLNSQMLGVLYNVVPLVLIAIVFIWLCSTWIARPLWQLAKHTTDIADTDSTAKISRIAAWYFEVTKLKQAVLSGQSTVLQRIGRLNLDVVTDPLTGLYNRRNLQQTVEKCCEEHSTFSIIVMDIDHFKRVNDRFGHDTGDMVLKTLARCLRHISRDSDLLYRTGGEEFLILLPDTPLPVAAEVAERMRLYIGQQQIDMVGYISVSAGVANWPVTAADCTQVMLLADKALYRAKATGRNKVVLAEANGAGQG